MEPILFYKTRGVYGSFSNFSRDEVTIFGKTWATSEAAFQAMKFYPHRQDLVSKVFRANLPSEAAAIGRDRDNPLHPLWNMHVTTGFPNLSDATVSLFAKAANDGNSRGFVVEMYKDAVMYLIVLAKFSQDPSLTKLLVETGDRPIIEDTRTSGDAYWGWGSDMKGKNQLGKILMGVRGVLATRANEAHIILNETVQELGLGSKRLNEAVQTF